MIAFTLWAIYFIGVGVTGHFIVGTVVVRRPQWSLPIRWLAIAVTSLLWPCILVLAALVETVKELRR